MTHKPNTPDERFKFGISIQLKSSAIWYYDSNRLLSSLTHVECFAQVFNSCRRVLIVQSTYGIFAKLLHSSNLVNAQGCSTPWCCSSRCWCSWLKTPNLLRWRSCCRCWSSSSRCGRLRCRNKSSSKSLILTLVLSTITTLFWLFIILSGQGPGNWCLAILQTIVNVGSLHFCILSVVRNLRGDLSKALHNIKENSSAVERLDHTLGEVPCSVRLVCIQEELHSVVLNVSRRHHLIHDGIILLVHLFLTFKPFHEWKKCGEGLRRRLVNFKSFLQCSQASPVGDHHISAVMFCGNL